jgi:hypothetical protein
MGTPEEESENCNADAETRGTNEVKQTQVEITFSSKEANTFK